MKIQLLSDLHLETETFEPEPAPGAELLVLAGDIDSSWSAFERFRAWPVPVLFIAGNHEFDRREVRGPGRRCASAARGWASRCSNAKPAC
jgi:predicted phosphodiesterase